MIPTYYSEKYDAPNQSMEKLSQIAEVLVKERLASIRDPFEEISENEIIEIVSETHAFGYVKSFLCGENPLAEINGLDWSPKVRDGVLAMNGGMIASVGRALNGENVVANLAQGFHHAKHEAGGAFCTFNGLVLSAKSRPDKKIFVLDCDEHQGDGTKSFVPTVSNLYNYTIFGSSFGDDKPIARNWDRQVRGWEAYESALNDAFTTILTVQPDLIIYQAGVDCHITDFGFAGLTTEELAERDAQVFEFAHSMGFPLVIVPAGGYTEHRVNSHTNTWRMAKKMYEL